MPAPGPRVRLRQAVIAASELEPVAGALRDALGLAEPFRDPGVGVFGLVNNVFAISDCFLEVISPSEPGTAAGRWLERHGGDGGYMVLFDLEDLDAARARASERDVRVVWQLDLEDISGTHLHPADMRGAIVSIDGSRPYGSWRWGGPGWTGRTGEGARAKLRGITVAVAHPDAVARRWAEVLGVQPDASGRALELDGGGAVRFIASQDDPEPGIVEIAVAIDPELRAGREAIEVGTARVVLSDDA
jgi:hypothetical protein